MKEHTSHTHHIEDLKKRFIITFLLTLPILLLSPMIWGIFGFELDFPYRKFVVLLFATIIYFYGGEPFLVGGFHEIKKRSPGMMTLISMAISVAYFYSVYALLSGGGKEFFWELATLIDIMLIGHLIEAKSIMGAQNALQELVKLIPKKAHKFVGKEIVDTALDDLKIGDMILVKPGEKIPCDGVVIEGESSVDESFLSGESKPIFKKKDEKVFMGSTNLDGSLVVKIEKSGKESYLSQVIELVKNAQKSRSQTQDIANRASKWLFFGSISVGVVTFIYWFPIIGVSDALLRTVSVLIIACPHALGLAVPLVVAISTTIGARHGILVRDRESFEKLKDVEIFCLDKTGTITEGKLSVVDVVTIGSKQELLFVAASLEQHSEHIIAQAIVDYAKTFDTEIEKVQDFQIVPGVGATGRYREDEIFVGNEKILTLKNLKIPKSLEEYQTSSYTKVWVGKNSEILGVILLSDKIKISSKEAIKHFQKEGIELYMLTGDNKEVAKEVAKEVGIKNVYAGLLPDEKLKVIEDLKKSEKTVCMVGDGINDAPSLMSADIGIAIGAGTDIAAQSAGIILTKNSLFDAFTAYQLSKKTFKKMVQNLWWASGYNIIAIPLAAGVLAKYGIIIEPAFGAVLMSASTVIVALNAQFLRRFDYENPSVRR